MLEGSTFFSSGINIIKRKPAELFISLRTRVLNTFEKYTRIAFFSPGLFYSTWNKTPIKTWWSVIEKTESRFLLVSFAILLLPCESERERRRRRGERENRECGEKPSKLSHNSPGFESAIHHGATLSLHKKASNASKIYNSYRF